MARNTESMIAGLLAKAERTDNAAEAEAYMAKAEELMLKNGIDRANLQSKVAGTKREEIVIAKLLIPNGHGYAMAMVKIAHAVGPSFSLRTLQSIHPNGARLAWLIGHKSDVEQAETLLASLLTQSHQQALSWWKKEGKAAAWDASESGAYLARREFIYAFASGVSSRLEETRNRVVNESVAGTDLVLVDRSTAVSHWLEKNVTTSKGRATRRQAGTQAAARAGHAAGRDSVSSKVLT